MKFKKSAAISAAFMLISFFILFFTPFFVYAKLNSGVGEGLTGESYKGILQLWHIDIFEGGSGSRADFLTKRAVEFEKINKGVLVTVKKLSKTEAEEIIKTGEFPDMVSFGLGVDFAIERAQEIKAGASLQDKFLAGGRYNGKQYAVPWCAGGYVLIGNEKHLNGGEIQGALDGVGVSKADYNLPSVAMLKSKVNFSSAEYKTPMENYVSFKAGKAAVMLGTQRDIIRLQNKGMNLKYQALSGFTDILQYISVTSESADKARYCEKFIEYLLSEKAQTKLTALDMFSVTGQKLYQDSELKCIEDALGEDFRTVSVFTASEIVGAYHETALEALSGNEEEIKKIENILL